MLIAVLLIRRAEGGQSSPALCRGVPRSPDYLRVPLAPPIEDRECDWLAQPLLAC
jgi:hypothetical protein